MFQAHCEVSLFESFSDGLALQASCMLFGQLIASCTLLDASPLAVPTQSQATFRADRAC